MYKPLSTIAAERNDRTARKQVNNITDVIIVFEVSPFDMFTSYVVEL